MPDRPATLPDDAWDDFVACHPHGHVLQTARWAALKRDFGWTTGRVTEGGASGASLLFRRLPWGQMLAYAPKGPLVNWEDAAEVSALLPELRRECARHHAALLKIEPELPASPALSAKLAALGFRPSPQRVQPLSTIHVDLSSDEATLLDRMKPKWRYNIRLAERKGVAVRLGGQSDLPAIQALLDRTGARDGFAVHSAAYYARATELFVGPGQATWLLAEHEGKLLAAIAVFALGRMAWYMWGASDDADRNLMPNHALQWAAMRWARQRGCEIYDLWGIPDEVGDDPAAYADPESWGSDGLWGVYRFKQGFGGQVVRYTGAWDLPLSAPGHALYQAALRLRKMAD
jgi:lipid II:glycine glycyltransferase (peptidoglycan interpeptide bridge formation enzyme)